MAIIMSVISQLAERLSASIPAVLTCHLKLLAALFVFLCCGVEVSAQGFRVLSQAEQPVLKALDHDADGVLSTEEIQSSPESLKTLDANRDGILSPAETKLKFPAEVKLPEGFVGKMLQNPRVQPLMNLIDRDGDWIIDDDEMRYSTAAIRPLAADGDWSLSPDEYAMRFENVGSAGADKSTEKGKAGSPDMRGFKGFARSMTTKNRGPFGATLFDQGVKPGEDSRAFDGYIFYSTHDTNNARTVGKTTWLLNASFQPVHRWDSDHHAHEGVGPYLLENGLVVRPFSKENWLYMENFYVASFTSLEIIDWEGNQLWEFDYCTPKRHCMHHDIEPMPNGNILLIVNDFKTHEEAEAIGFRPLNDRAIAFQRIIEIEPNLQDGSTRIVWEWDVLDHIVQDVYPDRPNYGKPSEHPGKIDVNYVGKSTKFIPGSVFHFNAISYNEERDQILVSNFGTNEIFIIDHSTSVTEARSDQGGASGKGGDLIYRWGNPHAYGMAGIESRQLFKQHDAAWIPQGIPGKGDISVFNNGVNREPAHTAYIEIKLPQFSDSNYQRAVNAPFGPPSPAYEFSAFAGDEPEVFFAPFMSGARRLPNGNIFGNSGIVSGIFEVTDEGEEVLRTVPGSRSTFYRAYKFPKDYSAFENRDLIPLATGWSIPR